ncbi:MAG: hypothetical protein F4X81_06415 [Gammaproteobacteria bacterium]|nr:hypothetical protein [Gammaproteobacteria bacterium]MYE51082.1 hypothetical protein [Gammaproteobacteria bacterium]MYF50311.1 hypothetical protein [Gammaproteobacteria bacterium]
MKRLGTLIKRRWLAVAAAVLAGVGVAWIAYVPPQPANEASAGDAGGPSPSTAPTAPQQPAPESASAAPETSEPIPEPLWRVLDETRAPTLPPYDERWSKAGRALVRLSADLAAAGSLGVGDRITLAVPQLGEPRTAVVETVDHGPGARSLLGWTEWDGGRPQRWVVTVAPTSLFAWIDTPEGPHELAVRQGAREGWLVPSASKTAGFDYSKPDTFVIDESGRRVAPRHGANTGQRR